MLGFCPKSLDGSGKHYELILFEGEGIQRHNIGVCRDCQKRVEYTPINDKIFNKTMRVGKDTEDVNDAMLLEWDHNKRERWMKRQR
jgi:hypothetical protein